MTSDFDLKGKAREPREFWIEQLNPQEDIVYRSANRVAYKAPEQIVHVIEYSAYDNLRADMLSLIQSNKDACAVYLSQLKETDNLRADLEVAKAELLQFKSTDVNWVKWNYTELEQDNDNLRRQVSIYEKAIDEFLSSYPKEDYKGWLRVLDDALKEGQNE